MDDKAELVDSHCHLNFPQFEDDISTYLDLMKQNNVIGALLVSVDKKKFPELLEISNRYANLFATVGVHPEIRPDEDSEFSLEEILSFTKKSKVIGIGECGFDYHWHPDKPSWQDERFEVHVEAAIATDLPLIIHSRKSNEKIIDFLSAYKSRLKYGVMHCFSGDWEFAKKCLDLGLYISFSGIVTFKNARDVQDVAIQVPSDRILIETDAPFLAPVPFRGKLNQPAFVLYVAEHLAKLRGVELSEIASLSTENFFKLFSKAERFELRSED